MNKTNTVLRDKYLSTKTKYIIYKNTIRPLKVFPSKLSRKAHTYLETDGKKITNKTLKDRRRNAEIRMKLPYRKNNRKYNRESSKRQIAKWKKCNMTPEEKEGRQVGIKQWI